VEAPIEDAADRAYRQCEVHLSDRDFNRFRKLIFELAGITLSEHKRALVYSRLAKRLRANGLEKYSDYYDLVRQADPDSQEIVEFINAITTNKSSFFREPHHFDYLREEIFPGYLSELDSGKRRTIKIWSAGCSAGQEPYTLAMTLLEYFGNSTSVEFNILATDIDTNVLSRASQGIYNEEQVEDIPDYLLRKYFLKGKGERAGLAKAGKELQSIINFERLNLFDPTWPMKDKLDIIFCRNVIIYFNRDTQRKLISRMTRHLKPGGYLMLGHSESLHGYDSGLQHVRKNVYRFDG
jgi:chemotaxis protein methyltransferase CheR